MPGRGSRRLSPNARATVNPATGDGKAGGTMHADDDRDPLDRWLTQQVPPLPPPPATFQLISRRARRRGACGRTSPGARRRQLRKRAVHVVSAAAVAAAVAVAVPVGLSMHLSPGQDSGALAGNANTTHSLTE